MNSHEIERIAAAMNQLRPDWPTRQLQTLLTDARITNRPRRDVTVALAWIACETGTSSPYRVLEAGPWWKAVAVDSSNSVGFLPLAPTERCGICGRAQATCIATPRFADDTHTFEPDFKTKRGDDVIEIVDALKAELTPMREPATTRQPTPGAGRSRIKDTP